MAGKRWTREESTWLKKQVTGGRHPADVLDELNDRFGKERTKEAAENMLSKLGVRWGNVIRKQIDDEASEESSPKNIMAAVAPIIHEAYKKAKPLDLDKVFDTLIDVQELEQSQDIVQLDVVRARIDTDKPIGLCFLSDLHLGNVKTDYRSMRRDLSLVRDHPQLYVMKGGDWPNKTLGSFRDQTAMSEQISPPQSQVVITEAIINALDGKVVAAIGGNHDNRDERATGLSTEYFIHRDKPFPYLKYGGVVKLTVGSQEYAILWKHHYKGSSIYNELHANIRARRELYPLADIVVMEHTHSPAVKTSRQYDYDLGRMVVDIRTGTYLLDDAYSRDKFKAGRPGPMVVVLYPDRHKIVVPESDCGEMLEDAVVYLRGFNHAEKAKARPRKMG
jgi:predicted phosphodiesterase